MYTYGIALVVSLCPVSVDALVRAGRQVLQDEGADMNDVRWVSIKTFLSISLNVL